MMDKILFGVQGVRISVDDVIIYSVAKAETVYLPVRTKCVTFVITPLGVVVVVCVIKTTWPLVVFDQYVRN